MKESRYNVFNQIHKALRALFYDTALSIQQTDFDKPEAAVTIEKLKLVLNLLDEHSHHEDTYLFPHVMKYDATLAAGFEKDHETDHKLAETLRGHISSWELATGAQRQTIGQSIFYAFNEFVAFNLYHMNKEEQELLYTLWAHYSDAELRGIQEQIIRSIQPEVLMLESEWMMRSLSNGEIISWMTGVKMNAPEGVFSGMLQMAENVLPGERWQTVRTALNTEAVTV